MKSKTSVYFVLVVVVSVIASLVGGLQNVILESIEVLYLSLEWGELFGFEVLPWFVASLFTAIVAAFVSLVFPVYYLRKGRA